MELIHPFNQTTFLEPVMRIDGWEEALEHGSCSAICAAFADFYFHSQGRDLAIFSKYLDENRANIVEQQTNAIEWHRRNLSGYNFLLEQRNLNLFGNEYGLNTFSNDFYKGTFALCVFKFNNNTQAHTIAIISEPQPENNIIYTFDPNFGLYQAEEHDWYNVQFMTFLNENYPNIDQISFNNIGAKLFI